MDKKQAYQELISDVKEYYKALGHTGRDGEASMQKSCSSGRIGAARQMPLKITWHSSPKSTLEAGHRIIWMERVLPIKT